MQGFRKSAWVENKTVFLKITDCWGHPRCVPVHNSRHPLSEEVLFPKSFAKCLDNPVPFYAEKLRTSVYFCLSLTQLISSGKNKKGKTHPRNLKLVIVGVTLPTYSHVQYIPITLLFSCSLLTQQKQTLYTPTSRISNAISGWFQVSTT